MSAVLPLKEGSREIIATVAHTLEPHFRSIEAEWRKEMQAAGLDERALAALERLQVGALKDFLYGQSNIDAFREHLSYNGVRLAKLGVDTRVIGRSLDLYQSLAEPHINAAFGDDAGEERTAMEMLSAAVYMSVSGAYFDAQSAQSSALLGVLDAELSAESLSALLNHILKITLQVFEASMGGLLLVDSATARLQVHAASGIEVPADFSVEIGQGFAGEIALKGEPDALLDPSGDRRVLLPELLTDAKSLWGMPLIANGETIGVLLIGFHERYEWLPTERHLMRAMADRSALAIDRARITEALREREARIAELSGHLMRVQEDERKRISRELHDETGQGLMVIRLYLGMLEQTAAGRGARTMKNKIRETVEVVDRTIEGIRRIIGRLSPQVLKELGLVAAIRKEAKDLAKTTGVRARVMVAEDMARLDPDTEIVIYRVVQEALHNITKHAQAKSANIVLNYNGHFVQLVVEDDGVGFTPRSNSRGKSFGLTGIKERVHSIGGEVTITTARGKGTRIVVLAPYAAAVPATQNNEAVQSAARLQ